MRLIFTIDEPISGLVDEEFIEGEYKFYEVPDLSIEADPFELLLQCQGLDMQFIWDDQGSTRWDEFMREKRKLITAIEIYNNNGDNLYFSGNIEPDSEIIANYAKKTIRMSFINENTTILEAVTTLGVVTGQYGAVLTDILDSLGWLTSCEYPLITDWLPYMPIQKRYMDMYGSDFEHILYLFDFTGMSNKDVLKTILKLGFSQIFIYSRAQKIICYGMIEGEIHSDMRVIENRFIIKEIIIDTPGVDSIWLYYDGPQSPLELVNYNSYIEDHWKEWFSNDKYEMQTITEKVEIGEVFEYNGELYLVTSWRPDLALIENDIVPLDITALKLVVT